MDQVHPDGGFVHPRTQPSTSVFVGRQGILDSHGGVHGYEFLYRAGRQHNLRVDMWPAPAQDRATLRVLQAIFTPTGVRALAADARVFVNFTRSFLVGELPVPDEPDRLVVEVVESVRTDAAVLAGVRRLRGRGFSIAIDDFVGLTSQVALLPYADYVKVDYRDLLARGPQLVELAASTGAQLIAERIETADALTYCASLGFRLFQGFHLDSTLVLNRTPVPSARSERPPLRVLDAARPRPAVSSLAAPAHAAAR